MGRSAYSAFSSRQRKPQLFFKHFTTSLGLVLSCLFGQDLRAHTHNLEFSVMSQVVLLLSLGFLVSHSVVQAEGDSPWTQLQNSCRQVSHKEDLKRVQSLLSLLDEILLDFVWGDKPVRRREPDSINEWLDTVWRSWELAKRHALNGARVDEAVRDCATRIDDIVQIRLKDGNAKERNLSFLLCCMLFAGCILVCSYGDGVWIHMMYCFERFWWVFYINVYGLLTLLAGYVLDVNMFVLVGVLSRNLTLRGNKMPSNRGLNSVLYDSTVSIGASLMAQIVSQCATLVFRMEEDNSWNVFWCVFLPDAVESLMDVSLVVWRAEFLNPASE